MPRWPGVGDAARNVIPAARVVYVDNDPVAVSHVKVLLAAGDETTAVDADLADPAAVTGHPAFCGIIDLAEPVCLVFGLVLNLFPVARCGPSERAGRSPHWNRVWPTSKENPLHAELELWMAAYGHQIVSRPASAFDRCEDEGG